MLPMCLTIAALETNKRRAMALLESPFGYYWHDFSLARGEVAQQVSVWLDQLGSGSPSEQSHRVSGDGVGASPGAG